MDRRYPLQQLVKFCNAPENYALMMSIGVFGKLS